MSSLTNINNNTRVVNVGRTTPVAPGQQPSAKSIPVVLASDQTAVPVIEQNKVQSEVALSLLGIPRSEVALGIFADVNTYDVNPTEWSSSPQYYNRDVLGNGFGIKHLPTEAGALVEAPRDQAAVLTSKRFFRYQPGRVSAATFGVKTSVNNSHFARNPVIRKYGIFDNFDGYYWESKQSGQGDNFSCVRRTQSLLKFPGSPFGLTTEILRKPTGNATAGDTFTPFNQTDDYRATGKEGSKIEGKYFVRERNELLHDSITLAEAAFNNLINDTGSAFRSYYNGLSTAAKQVYKDKCHRDAVFWMNMFVMDLEWGGDAHTRINTKNYTTAVLSTADREVELYTELRALILNDDTTSVQSATYVTGTNSIHNTSSGERSYAGATGTKLTALIGIPIAFFNEPGLGTVEADNASRIAASLQYTNTNNIQFGDKSRVETLFDTRVHYWSYFVTSFAYNPNTVDDKLAGYQSYEFQINSINAAFMPPGDFSNLVGYELSSDSSTGQYYPYDTTMTIPASDLPNSNDPVILNADQALALNEYYQNIKYKCARDLEYVINGYKNDLVGGGNAETLYNASMYYRGSGLSIYTQTEAGIPQEIAKHKHLRDWITTDLNDSGLRLGSTSQELIDLGDGLNTGLSKIIIDNFSEETVQGAVLGKRGFAGNLVVFRDGLLMTHAGVNDPNLLKEVEQIKAHISEAPVVSQPTRFKITKGVVTFGQKVRVVTTDGQEKISDSNSSASLGGVTVNIVESRYNQIYTVSRVYGPIGTEFNLQDQDGNDVYAYRNPVSNGLITDNIYVELVVPFIGDKTYNPAYYRLPNDQRADKTIQDLDGANVTTTYSEADDPFPIGIQWPYRYSSSTLLSDTTANYIGHIDTTVDPSTSAGTSSIRQQYDDINFNPEYINWIKNNVKPEFWGVYEYRIPRSRFSHDKLDGQTSKRLYSDLATGATGIVRPGMEVLDEDGIWVDAISEYDFDFTKVTMLKIEFSWYGAVGALFLAYVPIGNGEARWVRVHHLRASNQLKIASLGNATLPITYNVWGGGSPDTLGDEETKTHTYGTSQSHHIVKYGASYYIDGGDRGTVRLYSHNNNDVVKGYGKKWQINTSTNAGAGADGAVTVSGSTSGGTAYPNLVYFMGAQVKTNNPIDTGIKVVWADQANNKVYLSKQPQGTGLTLIPDRSDLVYGLETKDVIYSTIEGNPVRNRVQVYPTKMSTANLGSFPVRLQMKRTPVFQTLTQTGANVELAINGEYTISPNNLPLVVNETGGAGGVPYLQNGEEIFGWFQGNISDVDDETIFGRLYKKTNEYYFEVLQSFNGVVKLNDGGKFLKDLRFARSTSDDGTLIEITSETVSETPLADQLTSVKALNNVVVPIPDTGANVATLYLQPTGTEQVNLDTYFDYNKEYLSYPLTNLPETLYFAIDADRDVDEYAEAAIGLTWEEQ